MDSRWEKSKLLKADLKLHNSHYKGYKKVRAEVLNNIGQTHLEEYLKLKNKLQSIRQIIHEELNRQTNFY